MTTYFSEASFRFLRGLARHNERAWFLAHKAGYEATVREPFQRLLADLQPALAAISGQFRSEPKTVGGSLFRIQRDTRFSGDKAPYKSWQGARLFHARSRQVERRRSTSTCSRADASSAAAFRHPSTPALRRIRQFIVDNPGGWQAAAHARRVPPPLRPGKRECWCAIRRVPRGFRFIDDLRHKNFVAVRAIDDATMAGPRLRATLEKDLRALAPLVDYLCAALDLEF